MGKMLMQKAIREAMQALARGLESFTFINITLTLQRVSADEYRVMAGDSEICRLTDIRGRIIQSA